MIHQLPLTPPPLEGELFTSWLLRLAHANVQSLAYFTTTLTGDKDFWGQDQDRHAGKGVLERLEAFTGFQASQLRDLTLAHYEGRLFPRLPQRAPIRWILPLNKWGYGRTRPGMVYCPQCLLEQAALQRTWRLSFITVCSRHACTLLERCPHCQAPFCPQQGELCRGAGNLNYATLPHVRCGTCGGSLLEAPHSGADPRLLSFQRRLHATLEGAAGEMGWGEAPALESFDVLHQVLTVLRTPDLARYLQDVCALPRAVDIPVRRQPAFEDFTLEDRRRMLGQLEYLLGDWPDRFVRTCQLAQLTRRPLMVNFPSAPRWYREVAERLSQANGKRPFTGPALEPHLTLEEMQAQQAEAKIPSEARRWRILLEYSIDPRILPVARRLGESESLVRRTVQHYNARGLSGVLDPRRGSVVMRRRILSPEQAQEYRTLLKGEGRHWSLNQQADWVEARFGHRPSESTLWMYGRDLTSHSRAGRKRLPVLEQAPSSSTVELSP